MFNAALVDGLAAERSLPGPAPIATTPILKPVHAARPEQHRIDPNQHTMRVACRKSRLGNLYLSLTVYGNQVETASLILFSPAGRNPKNVLPSDKIIIAIMADHLARKPAADLPPNASHIPFPPFTFHVDPAGYTYLTLADRTVLFPHTELFSVDWHEGKSGDIDLDPSHITGGPSDHQLQILRWLAQYKGQIPPSTAFTHKKTWREWISSMLTRIDRDRANEARVDFGLKVDFDDPVSVISAIKYMAVVDLNDQNPRQKAAAFILAGQHPYQVQDYLQLSDTDIQSALDDIARRKPDFEINWGSN